MVGRVLLNGVCVRLGIAKSNPTPPRLCPRSALSCMSRNVCISKSLGHVGRHGWPKQLCPTPIVAPRPHRPPSARPPLHPALCPWSNAQAMRLPHLLDGPVPSWAPPLPPPPPPLLENQSRSMTSDSAALQDLWSHGSSVGLVEPRQLETLRPLSCRLFDWPVVGGYRPKTRKLFCCCHHKQHAITLVII